MPSAEARRRQQWRQRSAVALNKWNTSSSSPRADPQVEANRWSIADEHIERSAVQPVRSVVAVGRSQVRTGALEIHYFGETFSTPGRGPESIRPAMCQCWT